jgi:hypothetical protein
MQAQISANTLMRYFFPILFFLPLNFFMMVGGIGYGVQWPFFRYQITSLGTSIIPGARNLYFVLSGMITGKSGIFEILLILSSVILFAAFLFAMANRTKISGILTALSGATALGATVLQYGVTFHGTTGVCLPFGSVILMVFGLILYLSVPDPDADNLLVKYDYLFLLLGVFLIYSSWATPFYTNDTLAAQVLPYSILENHTVYLDGYQDDIQSSTYGFRYYCTDGGHYVSIFPLVLPVLITPLYILPVLLKIPLDGTVQMVMAHIASALVSALAVMFIYLACRYITGRKIALLSALVFAFATNTWAISSQTLYAHGMSGLLLAASIFLVMKNEKEPSQWNIVLLGLCSGLFVFNRPSDAFLVAPVFVYVVWYYRAKTGYYLAAGCLSGLSFLIYNLISFHNPVGGYFINASRFILDPVMLSHYLGLLIAPNRGLFVFSPVLILAVFGFWIIRHDRRPAGRFLQWSVVAMAVTIGIYASFDDWGGGETYGPRYLICLLPYLIIGLCIFFDDLAKKPISKLVAAAIALLITVSVFVQVVGVFYYPDHYSPREEWYNTWNSYNPWDPTDSVIINSLFHKSAKPVLRNDNGNWLNETWNNMCRTPGVLLLFQNDPDRYEYFCGMSES